MSERKTRPDVKEIKDVYDYLLTSARSLSRIKDAALSGRLFQLADTTTGVAGRSLAWKLFLVPAEPLQADAPAISPLETLRASREEYTRQLLKLMRAPDGSYEDGFIIPGTSASPPRVQPSSGNLERNNPLSLHDENPWTEWFTSMELRKTILQDVERTFPDIGYFRDPDVQAQLTNVLFLYSVTHPDIGYRQGMHELLAPLYYAVDYDSLADGITEDLEPNVKEMCARCWVAADAWCLFMSVMKSMGRWYEWQERSNATETSALASHVQLNVMNQGLTKPYVAPIVEACNRIQSDFLKRVDPELWRSLQNSGVEPQIYGIRWLRLLFTREFTMQDVMLLWDGLFACDPTFSLAQWVCVAMLIRIRNKLIPSDYSGQLTYLLRYSSAISELPTNSISHTNLLLRQALTLQMSPNPTTGVSVVHENYNLLDIPLEVPEPQVRRRARQGERGYSVSEQRSSSKVASHSRQPSTPMGLPEMFARGLLERGESLGINKTVMNAVSELKRNLPDLASSLARLPVSPPATSYAAYPLVDERPITERPPWEPRSRFEVEREVAGMRTLQRKLGDSVGWIVDTLLQDEGDDEEHIKAVKVRKREALECLAYVRDVLKGNVGDVEDERLIGEEELVKRRTQAEDAAADAATRPDEDALSHPRVSLTRLKPAVRVPASVAPHTQIARSAPEFPSTVRMASTVTRPPPKQPPMVPTQIVSPTSPPPSTSSPAFLTPSSSATPLAPWNYTRSSFSTGSPAIATLPRIPPRTSTVMRRSLDKTQLFTPTPPPLPPPGEPASRNQTLRRGVHTVQHDPLGALP